MLPASVMADDLFDGEAARLLLLGNALQPMCRSTHPAAA